MKKRIVSWFQKKLLELRAHLIEDKVNNCPHSNEDNFGVEAGWATGRRGEGHD